MSKIVCEFRCFRNAKLKNVAVDRVLSQKKMRFICAKCLAKRNKRMGIPD